jgi:protein TonB
LPSLTDAPPDLVLPRPKAEPDHATEAAPPAAPAAASAPPKVDAAPVGRTAAAAVRGLSDRERRALARWQVAIAAHLNLFKQAPANTRRKSGPMTVQVRFSIAPDGRVIDVAVHHSSGEAGYDAAAVAIVRRASPVPAPPPSAAASDLDFIIPIRFQPGD